MPRCPLSFFLFLYGFGFANKTCWQIYNNTMVYSWRFYMVWVDLLHLLQDLLFIWILCFGQREQCYVNKKKSSEVLRNKIFCQNTYPTTVKPCSYIPLMARNRYPEMTVLDWKSDPVKQVFFIIYQVAKYFSIVKQPFVTVGYSTWPLSYLLWTFLVPLQKYREKFQTVSLAKSLNFALSWSLHDFLLYIFYIFRGIHRWYSWW